MLTGTNQLNAVNDLHETIMDELRGEAVAVQIRVAFAVLVAVLGDSARCDPVETKVALGELRVILNLVQ